MAKIRLEAVRPKRSPFNKNRWAAVLEPVLTYAANQVRDNFEATTATWKTEVKFVVVVRGDGTATIYARGPGKKIYDFVNEGTRPHIIRPKAKRVLAFPAGYTRKTVPGVIGSKAGGPKGGQVHALFVRHPGTEPRNFDKIIAEEWRKKLPKLFREAIREMVR